MNLLSKKALVHCVPIVETRTFMWFIVYHILMAHCARPTTSDVLGYVKNKRSKIATNGHSSIIAKKLFRDMNYFHALQIDKTLVKLKNLTYIFIGFGVKNH